MRRRKFLELRIGTDEAVTGFPMECAERFLLWQSECIYSGFGMIGPFKYFKIPRERKPPQWTPKEK
jgi:hypothetical protein